MKSRARRGEAIVDAVESILINGERERKEAYRLATHEIIEAQREAYEDAARIVDQRAVRAGWGVPGARCTLADAAEAIRARMKEVLGE